MVVINAGAGISGRDIHIALLFAQGKAVRVKGLKTRLVGTRGMNDDVETEAFWQEVTDIDVSRM